MTRNAVRCKVIRILVMLLVWIILRGSELNATKPSLAKQIAQRIQEVKTGETSSIKENAAQRLAELTRGKDLSGIDESLIAAIASLLDSPDDTVRTWVAACLGHFGARAKFAVPKLEEVLAETDCSFGPSSAATIRPALRKIGVVPPPRRCSIK
jgi:HEAT repeat protein